MLKHVEHSNTPLGCVCLCQKERESTLCTCEHTINTKSFSLIYISKVTEHCPSVSCCMCFWMPVLIPSAGSLLLPHLSGFVLSDFFTVSLAQAWLLMQMLLTSFCYIGFIKSALRVSPGLWSHLRMYLLFSTNSQLRSCSPSVYICHAWGKAATWCLSWQVRISNEDYPAAPHLLEIAIWYNDWDSWC